jgi:hypothetical protein
MFTIKNSMEAGTNVHHRHFLADHLTVPCSDELFPAPAVKIPCSGGKNSLFRQ